MLPGDCLHTVVSTVVEPEKEEVYLPQQRQRKVGTCQPKHVVLNKSICSTTLWNEPFLKHQLLYLISHHTQNGPFWVYIWRKLKQVLMTIDMIESDICNYTQKCNLRGIWLRILEIKILDMSISYWRTGSPFAVSFYFFHALRKMCMSCNFRIMFLLCCLVISWKEYTDENLSLQCM
jgi:hypothetical protein